MIETLLQGLNTFRWQWYPQVEKTNVLEHAAMTLLVLSTKTEDIKKYFHYIFFDVLEEILLADVNFKIKKQIDLSKHKQFIKKFFLSYLDASYDLDVEEYYNNASIKDELYEYAKNVARWYEVKTNKQIFPTYYNNVSLLPLEGEIYDLFWRLKYNLRWNWTKQIFSESVLAHTFLVVATMYVINKNLANEEILAWLYHDVGESLTWDVIKITKKLAWWQIEEIEKELMKQYFEEKDYIFNPYKYKLVKTADNVISYFEANDEKTKEAIYYTLNDKERRIIDELKLEENVMNNWYKYIISFLHNN